LFRFSSQQGVVLRKSDLLNSLVNL
jgi:hypothetical protein